MVGLSRTYGRITLLLNTTEAVVMLGATIAPIREGCSIATEFRLNERYLAEIMTVPSASTAATLAAQRSRSCARPRAPSRAGLRRNSTKLWLPAGVMMKSRPALSAWRATEFWARSSGDRRRCKSVSRSAANSAHRNPARGTQKAISPRRAGMGQATPPGRDVCDHIRIDLAAMAFRARCRRLSWSSGCNRRHDLRFGGAQQTKGVKGRPDSRLPPKSLSAACVALAMGKQKGLGRVSKVLPWRTALAPR